jgi:hypothetical protein
MATGYQQQAYYASPQAMQAGPQQPVVQLMPAGNPTSQSNNKRKGFGHNSARRCGLLQIFCGLISMGAAAAMLYYCAYLYFVGTGFWCGLIYLISGSLGVRSAHKKSNCMIVSCMVLCIFSIFFAIAQGGFSGFGLYFEMMYDVENDEYYGFDLLGLCSESYGSEYAWQIRVGLEGALVGAAIIEFIVAIIQSIVSCAGVCCVENGREQVVVYVPQQQQLQPLQQQQPQGEVQYMNPVPQQPVFQGHYPGARPSLNHAASQPLMSHQHPGPSDRPGSVALPLDAMVPPMNPEYGTEPPPYDPHFTKMQ